MKAGVTPILDQAWWSKNKSKTLLKTGLGKALGAYQADAKALEKACAAQTAWYAVEPLKAKVMVHLDRSLPAAVSKAKGKANKLLHKNDIAALEKYASVIAGEKKRVELMTKSLEARQTKARADLLALEGQLSATLNTLNDSTIKAESAMASDIGAIDALLAKAAKLKDPAKDAKPLISELDAIVKRMGTAYKQLQADMKNADTTRRKWTYQEGQLYPKGGDKHARSGDRLDGIVFSIRERLDRADSHMKKAFSRQNDVLKVLKGSADKIAFEARAAHSALDSIKKKSDTHDATLRELSGTTDRVKFDIINAGEPKHAHERDKLLKRAADEIKTKLGGQLPKVQKAIKADATELSKARKALSKELLASEAGKNLPPEFDSMAREYARLLKVADEIGAETKKLAGKLKDESARVVG